MTLPLLVILSGLALLIWSADRFIDGAAAIAHHYGMPALLVGIIVIGFGTSAPEMMVSALAAWQGTPSLALGNAYGSNIANIGLILGTTALISPIAVQRKLFTVEFPFLLIATVLAVWQLRDHNITRTEAAVLLALFMLSMAWSIVDGFRQPPDPDTHSTNINLRQAWITTLIGLVLLLVASRAMVWGAATIARQFGIDELIIGLTIFAIGTSLPELAAAISAIRKHQHAIALGNVIGSNLFNTLTVVGIAGIIHPMQAPTDVFTRDIPVMIVMTLTLIIMSTPVFKRGGRINRLEGGLLLSAFIAYNLYLFNTLSTQTG